MKTSLFLLSVLLSTGSLFASNGEELFQAKCASCHTINKPADMSTMLAPPLRGLMYHMSESFESKEDTIAHINSFVMNPTKEKAICRSVRRFGVMPSQKGLLTSEELDTIAKWMANTNTKNCKAKKSQ